MPKVFLRNPFHLLLPSGSEDLVPLDPAVASKCRFTPVCTGLGAWGLCPKSPAG